MSVTIDEKSSVQPMYRLAEHLVVLYGRNQLPLIKGGLLDRLITGAAPDIRRHAMAFIGFSMEREPGASGSLAERLAALWDRYWEMVGPADAAEEPRDHLFGQWFSSGVFPAKWSLDCLEKFVDIVPMPAPENEVVPRLASVCDTDIAQSVRILSRIVEGDKEGWRIHMWRESAVRVIEQALKAGGTGVKLHSTS